MKYNKKCLNCNSEFSVYNYRKSTAKFCSRSCNAKFYKSGNKVGSISKKGYRKINKFNITKKYLENLYWKENMTTRQIANKISKEKKKISYTSVSTYMKEIGIPMKDNTYWGKYRIGRKVSFNVRNKIKKTLKGRKHTEERKKNIKTAWKTNRHKYEKAFNKKEYKEKLSRTHKKLWENKEYRKRMLKVTASALATKRPTSFETTLLNIIRKNNLTYNYTGDGKFRIGRYFPDFVNTNGKKICLEVFYSFHKIRNYKSVNNYKQKRIDEYKKYGWIPIFFSENEYFDENKVLNKIKEVENNV